MRRLPSRTAGGGGQVIEVMARGIWQVGAGSDTYHCCRWEFGIEPFKWADPQSLHYLS
jgi:hypothetical protein